MNKNDFLRLTPETVEYDRIYTCNSSDFDFEDVFKKYFANRGGRNDNGLVKHIQDIAIAIINDGGTSMLPPIIVDINTMQIVDGNCRFEAMLRVIRETKRNLDMRVVFINVPDGKFDDYVIRYNEGHRNWTLLDYIYNLSERGVSSLTRFIEFCSRNVGLYDEKKNDINPRYGAAALGIPHTSLKKHGFELTKEQIEHGEIVAKEASMMRALFSNDPKANGGGWYEPYLRAWSEFRFKDNVLGDITFEDYHKTMKELMRTKTKANVPYGSNKKSDWNSFFRNVRTYC